MGILMFWDLFMRYNILNMFMFIFNDCSIFNCYLFYCVCYVMNIF